MTRIEAMKNLVSTWLQRDQEFCVGERECARSEDELIECLRTIGASEEEIKEVIP